MHFLAMTHITRLANPALAADARRAAAGPAVSTRRSCFALVGSLCTLLVAQLPAAALPLTGQYSTSLAAASFELELPDGASLVALPPTPTRVLDLQGWLAPRELERLERILAKLQADTGFQLLVVTQNRARARAPDRRSLLEWCGCPPAGPGSSRPHPARVSYYLRQPSSKN